MILAAGEGRRMRPLTLSTPKPLLAAGGKPLIVHLIERLAAADIRDLVINHAWLGEQLEEALGDGADFGVRIRWSREGSPLETAGGIIQALPLLGAAPFVLVNGDIWTDYSFRALPDLDSGETLAHLVLVPNPAHNPRGDFALDAQGRLHLPADAPELPVYTYCGVSAYHPAFFTHQAPGFLPLKPLWDACIRQGRVSAELHRGAWFDVGTPERLAELDARLRAPG